MKFSEHGSYTIEIRPNFLYINTVGPFNAEIVKTYSLEVVKAVEALSYTQWQQLVVLHGLALMIPSAQEALQKSLQHRKEMGLIRVAIVLGNTEAKTLLKTQYAQCYQFADIEHVFF